MAKGRAGQPIAGFPSKTEAIKQLFLQGLSYEDIAERAKTTETTVSVTINRLRRLGNDLPHRMGDRPRKAPDPDTRGIWTPEKIGKARRLFGKTMIYIAEALEVPPGELLSYALNGVLPPIGKPQRLAQLLEQLSDGRDVAPVPNLPLPPPPPPPAPIGDPVDDDAEDEPDDDDDFSDEGDVLQTGEAGEAAGIPFVPAAGDAPSRAQDEADLAALSAQDTAEEQDDEPDPDQSPPQPAARATAQSPAIGASRSRH